MKSIKSTLTGNIPVPTPHVFSLSTCIDIRNRGAAILANVAVIAAAIQDLDAALQTFCEDRSTAEMQAVITATRNVSDEVELHAERVVKLKYARSYLNNGGKLVPTGGAPW